MRRARRAITLVIILAVIGGLWWFLGYHPSESSKDIFASGFIEAKDVAISAEIGGRIVDIAVDEGDSVQPGAVLVRLDDSLLKTQQLQAMAGVELARANLAQATVIQDGSEKAWEDARDIQQNPLELDSRIVAAQGELDTTQLNLKRVEEIDSAQQVAAAEIRRDTAQKVLDNIESFDALGLVTAYQINKEKYPAEGELALAELNLAYQKKLNEGWNIPAAELRRDIAQKSLDSLLAIRNNPQEINSAADQAYASYQTSTAAVEVAKSQMEQSKAALKTIAVQLDKLAISSPISGVVSARNLEVGEVIQPGAPILNVIGLEEVTLTAYVPESKIGLVKLGQKAVVSVDSYPGESFPGEVVYISPQAMFTPKNIQLKEEREKMVFAVKIKLANPEQKLKAGMPADVQIPY